MGRLRGWPALGPPSCRSDSGGAWRRLAAWASTDKVAELRGGEGLGGATGSSSKVNAACSIYRATLVRVR